MNPAVRVVAEGYRGLIQGGDAIRRMESAGVGRILQYGGTIIGTARSLELQQRDGRRRATSHRLISWSSWAWARL